VADLTRNVAQYQTKLQDFLDNWVHDHAADLRRLHLPESMPDFVRRYQGDMMRYVQFILARIFGALETTASAIGWVVVVPIVTLYLLADMDKLRARLFHLVPTSQRDTVRDLASQVGQVFVAYLRGLILVCACYGLMVYLVLGLWFTLPYALILSLGAVILYAVPYLGQLTLIVVSVCVAWLTGRTGFFLGEVAVVLLAVGQCFDQIITPRVIGRQVGLHPVIGLFSLMVGAQMGGPLGMVIAVPVAAALRVVLIQLFPRLGEPIPASELAAVAPPKPEAVEEQPSQVP
jgi:predicted PurR-regulated permease PerM